MYIFFRRLYPSFDQDTCIRMFFFCKSGLSTDLGCWRCLSLQEEQYAALNYIKPLVMGDYQISSSAGQILFSFQNLSLESKL